MQSVEVEIKGILPLLMHSGDLADPLDERPGADELKTLSGKRNKTKADYWEIARLEWLLSLYTNEDGKICVPSDNLEACIRDGGRKSKKGKDVEGGIFVYEDAPLIFDGPNDPNKLWKDRKFVFRRPAKVQRNRVMRTRPRFDNWSLKTKVYYDPSVIADEKAVLRYIGSAGGVGLGDWRPKFGRFEVV